MKKVFKFLIVAILLIGIAAATTLYIQSHTIAVLEPKGFIGEKERNLIVTASELMLIVVIPVLLMTLFFSWRYREGNEKAKHTPNWEHNAIAEYFWWGIPFIIITCLAVITWKSSYELSPFKSLQSNKKAMTIQAVALQWKWLFIYPEQGIATVNYIEFPVNVPIKFEITADAPMNSFWIPELGGQIYAMPAMKSELNLIANKTGTFKGLSSNISGTGFAGMTFKAKATSQAEFDQWISSVKSGSKGFSLQDYNQLVLPSENNPVSLYVLKDPKLFEEILMKYMKPRNKD